MKSSGWFFSKLSTRQLFSLRQGIVSMDTAISRSILFFELTGMCEIGGGYLIWLWQCAETGAEAGVGEEF